MNTHLAGFGLIGSLLAWRLHAAGRSFTWSDIDDKYCAWGASTGCVYPTGDTFEADNYRRWAEWIESPPWEPLYFDDPLLLTEIGAYWYSTKQPPFGAKGRASSVVGNLKLSPHPSYHLNVQSLVTRTRAFFQDDRCHYPPPHSRIVVSHGYHYRRIHHLVWGWSALATLRIDRAVVAASGSNRPLFSLRPSRFRCGYAYPAPGTPYWYIGSALIPQSVTRAKSLNIAPKLEKWRALVDEVTDGLVSVDGIVEQREGWRPAPEPLDYTLVREIDGQLVIRPMGHSGVRCAPRLLEAVMEKL